MESDGRTPGPLEFFEIIQNSPDGVAVIRDGLYLFANFAWAQHLGTYPEALVGVPIETFVPSDQRERLRAWMQQGQGSIEVRFLLASGASVILQLTLIPRIRFAGQQAVGLVGRDLTRLTQQHAQRLLADRMMSIGALASGLAHDINNPLAVIMGNLAFLAEELNLLAESQGDPAHLAPLLEALRDAQASSERVRGIVRDLGEFSRADQGTLEPISVNTAMEAALGMTWPEIRHRARLVRDLKETPEVRANSAKLRQAFLNVLLHTAHDLPLGQANAHQVIVRSFAREGWVVVEVAHDGPALSAAMQEQIFDSPFTSNATGFEAGFGLSIAHSILLELGGRITVASAPGYGTLFEVRLPALVEARTLPSATTSDLPAPSGRILVIDDEPLIVSSLSRLLRNHAVVTASSGREAVRLLANDQAFDLILCDLRMPEMTGEDVFNWIRQNAASLEPRVAFMTAGVFGDGASFLEQVDNPRINKPYALEAMRNFVDRNLRRSVG